MTLPGITELVAAEDHYRALSHIDDICLLAPPTTDGRPKGVFAVVVPNAQELSARKVASARQRIGELFDIAGCVLPAPLRIADFVLIDRPLPRDRDGNLCREDIAIGYPPGQPGAVTDSQRRLLDEPLSQRALGRLEEVLGIPGPFSVGQNLESDLGMDSLLRMQLRIVLEEEFGVEMADDDVWRLQTVGDLLRRVAEASVGPEPGRAELSWGEILRQPTAIEHDRHHSQTNFFGWAFFGLARVFARAVLRVFYGAKVSGMEKLPRTGPLLLCPNHLSYLDSPIAFCLLPSRLISRTHFLGYREIFREPPLSWMVRSCRLILTGDAESGLDSLRLCHQALGRGDAVCVFPEGIRSTRGTLMPAKPGIGMLACESQAPIVPILIEGSEATMSPPNPGFHRCKVRVVVGDPIAPPKREHFTVADYQSVADGWREAVLRLRDQPDSR